MSSNHTKRGQQICFLHRWTSALIHPAFHLGTNIASQYCISSLCLDAVNIKEHLRKLSELWVIISSTSPLGEVQSAHLGAEIDWAPLAELSSMWQRTIKAETGRTASWSALLSVTAWFVASYMPRVMVITSGQSNHGQSQRTRKEIDLRWSSSPTGWILNPPKDKKLHWLFFCYVHLPRGF